jgi:hypothetical protein
MKIDNVDSAISRQSATVGCHQSDTRACLSMYTFCCPAKSGLVRPCISARWQGRRYGPGGRSSAAGAAARLILRNFQGRPNLCHTSHPRRAARLVSGAGSRRPSSGCRRRTAGVRGGGAGNRHCRRYRERHRRWQRQVRQCERSRVLVGAGRVFASNETDTGASTAITMQGDGNLVAYSPNGIAARHVPHRSSGIVRVRGPWSRGQDRRGANPSERTVS